MSKLKALLEVGQSVWLDFVRRSHTEDGSLAALVAEGVRGVTSNPAIFRAAITGSNDYDAEIAQLAATGESDDAIFEKLALADIGRAADVLRPVFDESSGGDGFASLEVDPGLAHDTEGTVRAAQHLWSALARPNVMIKVPATAAGVRSFERLTAEGINVNVTLIFSVEQYGDVAEAYLRGLERRAEEGAAVDQIASVASFFVSRVDAAVDPLLDAAPELRGTVAIANAELAYERFGRLTTSERWRRLAERGAKVQRPLWASTGTKDPSYPDTLYVDRLIGRDTVNTVPPATLEAFRDHGRAETSLGHDPDGARSRVARLAELGIDLDAVTARLLDEGVAAFADAHRSLLACIAHKREQLAAA